MHVAGPSWSATYYFPEGWEHAGGRRSADFVMTITRAGMHRGYDAPIVLTVERMGVPLAYVYDLRAPGDGS